MEDRQAPKRALSVLFPEETYQQLRQVAAERMRQGGRGTLGTVIRDMTVAGLKASRRKGQDLPPAA